MGEEFAQGGLDELCIVWARWAIGGVEHVGDVPDALGTGVHVDGQGQGGVIVVEDCWISESLYDPLHFPLLLVSPCEGGALLGQGPEVPGVLEQDTGEGGQGGGAP